jgi:hypothetical protein
MEQNLEFSGAIPAINKQPLCVLEHNISMLYRIIIRRSTMLPEARHVHIDRPVLANPVQLTQRADRQLEIKKIKNETKEKINTKEAQDT